MLIGSFTINKAGLSFKEKTIQKIIVWHYYLLNFILLAFQKLLFRNKNLLQAKRILIFRTGSIGDSICALPAIYSIRKNFPDANIDILTNAGSENLVSLGALIDKNLVSEIIDYFGVDKKSLIENLKKKKYDLFIQLPQDQATVIRQIRDMLFVKMLGIKKAFGWEKAATRFLANWQARLINFINERDRLLNIIERNGLKKYGMIFPIGIDDEVKIRVNLIVAEKNINEVAQHLLKEGYNIFLFGSKDDLILAQQIEGDNVYNFCGELEPLETAVMMKLCKLVISNDSGPMHLAYAVAIPVIAIFSSRDYPNKWFPPDNNIVLRSSDSNLCTECLIQCKRDHQCLKIILPSQVLKTLKEYLTN